jgi:hypothetical protein
MGHVLLVVVVLDVHVEDSLHLHHQTVVRRLKPVEF